MASEDTMENINAYSMQSKLGEINKYILDMIDSLRKKKYLFI